MVVKGTPVSNWYHCRGAGIFREGFSSCPEKPQQASLMAIFGKIPLIDHYLSKFIGTKGSVYIRKEFNSHRTGLENQHGRPFTVLEHQYGRRDVV